MSEDQIKAIHAWERETLQHACKTCKTPCCYFTSDFMLGMHSAEELVTVLGEVPEDPTPYLHAELPDMFVFKDGFCPQYDRQTKQCKIYDNPHRPGSCHDFPLVAVSPKRVVISSHCPVNKGDSVFGDLENRLYLAKAGSVKKSKAE